MTVAKRYSELIHEKSGWWGTFPVPYHLRVGDYIQLADEGQIKYLGTVFDFGWGDKLAVEPFTYAGQEVYRAHVSESRSAGFSAGVDVVAGTVSASAELTLAFSAAAGYVLVLKGARGERFRSVAAAKKHVTPVLDAGNWEREWVLITEVIHAESVSALIAEEDSSSLVLTTQGTLPSLDLVTLADPSLHLSSHVRSGSVYTSLCGEATPLFHCLRVRRGFLGTDLVPSGVGEGTDDDLYIGNPWGETDV